MTHTCPGSRAIANLTTDQCGDAECAMGVLILAAAICGLKAGVHPSEMTRQMQVNILPAEILSGEKRAVSQ